MMIFSTKTVTALVCASTILFGSFQNSYAQKSARKKKGGKAGKVKKEAAGMKSTKVDFSALFDAAAIGAAIKDMGRRFPKTYPAQKYLAELAVFARKSQNLNETLKSDPNFKEKRLAFKRRALLSNPLLTAQPLLITVREQYWGSHCAHGTMFQNGNETTIRSGGLKKWRGDGGLLRVLKFDKMGKVIATKDIVKASGGVVRDPDVHFSGGRVIFSMRRSKSDDYKIYEVKSDGSALRQLTYGKELSDIDPIYLPDGKILFSSTRQPKYCQCNVHIQTNMFLMEGDGANIIQISRNNLSDFHSSLMPDGKILYSRWEYIDRHFGPSLGLWTSSPDGTNHQLYMGNNHWTPGAMIDGRAIPGTNLVVCIYGACHDRPWGAMTIVNRSKGMEGPEPVVKMWPAEGMRHLLPNDPKITRDTKYKMAPDSFLKLKQKYEDPWPLHNMKTGSGGGSYFLVSRTIGGYKSDYGGTDGVANMGIFLVDKFGNETLVYDAEGERNSCFDPMPMTARKRPPIIPSKVDFSKKEGIFYVMDVYQGTGDEMVKVKRGSAKWLRVLEGPPKLFYRDENSRSVDARQASPMNWNLTNNKRILGDVPVEADGSVNFYAPADKFLHFLLLDENKMMIQAMRTGTMLRPGEVQGCIGCHENRLAAPTNIPKKTIAMQRRPSRIKPWLDYRSVQETPAFNYLTEVQPVFDKHCISCHDYGKKAGKKLNLAGDVGLIFNTSYTDLMRRGPVRYEGPNEELVSIVHDGPPGVLPAYSWGSHKSSLVKTLLKGHQNVKLSSAEMHRIISWIDVNGVYYGEYSSVHPGRVPLSSKDYKDLLKLAGIKKAQDEEMKSGSLVSFTRPELSPILAKVGGKGSASYNKALAIIKKGAAALKTHPREDQTGGKTKLVYPEDIRRQKRYDLNLSEEAKSIKAILSGTRYYQYKK